MRIGITPLLGMQPHSVRFSSLRLGIPKDKFDAVKPEGVESSKNAPFFHQTSMFQDQYLYQYLLGLKAVKGRRKSRINPRDNEYLIQATTKPGYLQRRFGDALPARIIVGGCSAGMETYSLAMALSAHRPGQMDRVSIEASDISQNVINLAKDGVVWVGPAHTDFEKARLVLPEDKIVDYFSMTDPDLGEKRPGLMAQFEERMATGDLVLINPQGYEDSSVLYPIREAVRAKVRFETMDFKDLKLSPNEAPVLVVFRGVLGLYAPAKKEELLKDLYAKLPVGSTLVVKSYDLLRGALKSLKSAGFDPVVPYEDSLRTRPIQNRYQKHPELLLFEKN